MNEGANVMYSEYDEDYYEPLLDEVNPDEFIETNSPEVDQELRCGVVTAPPTTERGGATLAVAPSQAMDEGRTEQRHSGGHSCQELPPHLPTQT